MIEVTPQPSAIAAMLITVVVASLCFLVKLTPSLRYEVYIAMVVTTVIGFKHIFCYKQYHIKIDSKQDTISLIHDDKHIETKLKWFGILRFIVIIILLRSHKKLFIVPIFYDSIPLKDYKNILSYLRWR